ncbi:hypothetical protein LUZ61_005577 [Rhynchospora tenuis]|uniref:Holocarboxylase synthetase n=1 Tax=Rhynchospora tenuis TaxID=198213 RepID=A0AAD5ZPX4_9POAL|nr:hypothetical protein LUZ61_005577 [Rhynchospora tenuis]
MGRKRKNEAVTRLDEADRTLYTSFRGAANALSQLYTQSMTQQKLSFQAGERHAMDKLYHWIVRQHEEGSRVTISDILSHIQHEMEYGSSDGSVSPRVHTHAAMQFPNPNTISPQANVFAQPRLNFSDQSRNSVFSNALSSPVRRSLQSYQLSQGDGYCSNSDSQPTTGGPNNSSSCNDASMDMLSDSPFR